jgi:hypothetical protein
MRASAPEVRHSCPVLSVPQPVYGQPAAFRLSSGEGLIQAVHLSRFLYFSKRHFRLAANSSGGAGARRELGLGRLTREPTAWSLAEVPSERSQFPP